MSDEIKYLKIGKSKQKYPKRCVICNSKIKTKKTDPIVKINCDECWNKLFSNFDLQDYSKIWDLFAKETHPHSAHYDHSVADWFIDLTRDEIAYFLFDLYKFILQVAINHQVQLKN